MSDPTASALRFIVTIAFISFSFFYLNEQINEIKTVPSCQEDEVIVGVGDYSNGTWTGYRCENLEEVN